MPQYLISFASDAMKHIPDEDMPAVAAAAHAFCREAIEAGVYVLAGGLADQPASVVAPDGTVTDGPRPTFLSGLTIVDVPSRQEALRWAAKVAAACRCPQEVREVRPDPHLDVMVGDAGEAVPTVKQVQVTFDCAEPERLARFWCEVLGYVVPPPPEGLASWDDYDRALPPERQGSAFTCMDPTGVGPRLFFQRVPEGKVVKNRVHLDVRVGTGMVGEERVAALEAECARLVALGAARVRLLRADEFNESCLVMRDIEGNEFCLD